MASACSVRSEIRSENSSARYLLTLHRPQVVTDANTDDHADAIRRPHRLAYADRDVDALDAARLCDARHAPVIPACPEAGVLARSRSLAYRRPMKFAKSPAALVQLFNALQPEVGGVRKQMFGYPCAFENGHLFAGL